MKAVILAGGKGTRLLPYTTVLPKPLMPIGEKPILEIILAQLKKSGINEIIMAVGYLEELIRAYFGDGGRFGLKIDYSREENALGTAGPLTVLSGLSGDILVMNGDILSDIDYGKLIEKHQNSGNDITVCSYDKRVKIDLGVLKLDANDGVVDYIEKPEYRFDVSMGIYVMKSEMIGHIPKNQRFDMPDLVKKLISAGLKVGSYQFSGEWYDIGLVDDYQVAQKKFAQGEGFLRSS